MTTASAKAPRALALTEKVILGFIAGAAAAIGIIELVMAVGRIIEITGTAPTTLHDVPLAEPAPASGIDGADYERVTLHVAGLPGGAIAALVGASVLGTLLTVGICAFVAWLCLRVFLGKPFVRSITWGVGIVAILALAVALGVPLLTGIANAEAATLLDTPALPALLVEIDPAPIGWAFALTVIAAAFELGQRLQRDTEGLV